MRAQDQEQEQEHPPILAHLEELVMHGVLCKVFGKAWWYEELKSGPVLSSAEYP